MMRRLLLGLVVGASALSCGKNASIDDDAANTGDASSQGTQGQGTTGDGGVLANRDGAPDTAGDDDGSSTDGSTSGPPDTKGPLAASASAFLDTIGICTHIGQGVDDPTEVTTALQYVGARGIRDDGHPEHVQDWINVHNATGVKLSLLTNQDVGQTIDMAKHLNAASALLAVEGPNEPNNFAVTYQGQTASSSTTFVPVANLQKDLYAAVHAEPTLSGVPVFHSSEAGGSEPDDVGLQFLTIPADAGTILPSGTKYADYANTHNYVCGHLNDLVDNNAWQAEEPMLDADWDGMKVEYGTTWAKGFTGNPLASLPSIPRVTTETGWVTDGAGNISREQQARLFLDLYLSAYKQGWSYTFVYMLRDEPGQGNWGFFDMNYVAKTSATYLHNLTTILADTAKGPLGHLDYSIANEPATVHDLLLQKADGAFELVVWDERFAGSGGSDSVTVTLAEAANVTTYDPTTGAAATATTNGVANVPLTLSDHPVILEITR